MPATIMVYRPLRGVRPLAMVNAMASGIATTATISPAVRSETNCRRFQSFRVVAGFGTSI